MGRKQTLAHRDIAVLQGEVASRSPVMNPPAIVISRPFEVRYPSLTCTRVQSLRLLRFGFALASAPAGEKPAPL